MIDVLVIGGIYREVVLRTDGPAAQRIGGSGFTAAVAAARLGAEVSLASFVGDVDDAEVRSALGRAGVEMDALTSLPGRSGIFEISDARDEMRPRPMYRPAESTPTDTDVSLPPARVILAFGFPDFDPVPWIRSGLRSDSTLLWDHQGWLSRDVDVGALTALPAFRKAYLANLNEMRRDVGARSYAEALRMQPPPGFDVAVIKCGRWGTLLVGEEEELVPAFHIEVVSSIGSGDVFGGALATHLAHGRTMPEAALTASASAALFVERAENLLPVGADQAVERLVGREPRSSVDPRRLEATTVYLAGPFFTAAEQLWLDVLERMIEELGFALVGADLILTP